MADVLDVVFLVLGFAAGFGLGRSPTRFKTMPPSAGTRSTTEFSRPFQGTSSLLISPTLAMPVPPNSFSSLVKISFQMPDAGMPTR